MLGLAIHTSSPQLGLSLQSVDPETELASSPVSHYRVWDLGREVSSQLHVKLVEFVKSHCWQDLSFVAVAIGPGGFTGTRIGVVAARTLAQQLNIPLFGVSSLAALAAQHVAQHGLDDDADISVMMPAKREAVFGAVYRWQPSGDLQAIRPDEVLPAQAWHQALERWPRAVTSVTVPAGEGTAASVQGVMQLAMVRWRLGQRPKWTDVMPFYGQHPVQR